MSDVNQYENHKLLKNVLIINLLTSVSDYLRDMINKFIVNDAWFFSFCDLDCV